MFSVLESMLKDQYDGVKYGVISHLAEFLEIFDHGKREDLVDIFLNLQRD